MHTHRLGLLVLALTLVTTGAARAQDDYARNGAYLGLAGSLGIYTEHADDIEEPLGLNARAGYRFHPHVAAEGEFEWLSEAEVDNFSANIEAWTTTANVKAFLLKERVQPFALVGMGFTVMEGSAGGRDNTEAAFAMRFGVGLDLYVTENFLAAFDVGYVLPVDDVLDELDYVRIGWGLGYRF